MRRQVVELQGLDMRERSGVLQAGNVRNCGVGSDVEKNAVPRQRARPSVAQGDLQRLGRRKTRASHDQFGAARLVGLQVESNLAAHHVALALTNLRHIGGYGAGRRTELRGMPRLMRDSRAPDLILAGQAGDIGTGSPNPPAFHDSRSPPRSRHMPGQ